MAPTKKYIALIVDGDTANVAINVKYLSRNGFEIRIAKNGQEAIQFFQDGNQCHLVVMDMEMPIMDGCKATKEIRALGVNGLIIGMSSPASPEKIQEFVNAGINAYYPKPMNMAKLAAIVEVIEAMAARNALQKAIEAGFRSIVLQTDNLKLYNHLQKKKHVHSAFVIISNDIRCLASLCNQVEFSHVKRNGNRVAHELAKASKDYNELRVWLEDIPQAFEHVVLVDIENE